MIRRPLYMDKLSQAKSSELVKIIVGVRRCGKSTLLKQLRNDLIESGVSPNEIIELSFELPSNEPLQDRKKFIELVKDRVDKGSKYLMVDEVQELKDWEKTINGIRAEFGMNIYVTGSNARMLAGEGMTYLSGRYVKIEAFPLSLEEICQFSGRDVCDPQQVQQAYNQLVSEGGFPAIALSSASELKDALMDGIYDSVFMRDVVLRGKIRNEAAFLRTASFVMDNIGSLTSANSIARSLKTGGHAVNAETVDNYLALMQKAHLIYKCERYDIKGKERLKTNGKYYVVDMGLRNRVLGPKNGDRGHVTENIVFLELKRRGFEVFVGTLPSAEIDFVAQKGAKRIYIQVSETVMDPSTLERELKAFEKLKDGYPRVLITKDIEDFSHNGARHVNLYDFLLGEELPI